MKIKFFLLKKIFSQKSKLAPIIERLFHAILFQDDFDPFLSFEKTSELWETGEKLFSTKIKMRSTRGPHMHVNLEIASL